jgi:hypothetical protein
LEQNLNALAAMPTLSVSDAHLTVERTQNLEIGYERVAGSRTYSAGAYDESVSNAAFMLSGPADFISAADLLPDLGSRSNIFNIGSFHRTGYNAGVKQTLGDHAEVSVMAGRAGVLTAPGTEGSYADSQALRAGIRQAQRAWVTIRVAGTVPQTGTRIAANYGWTDFRVLMPVHLFVTQAGSQDIGVNLHISQPLPLIRVPWRMEATADLSASIRNPGRQSGYRRESPYQPAAASYSRALANGSDGRPAQSAGARVSAFRRYGWAQRPHEFAASRPGRIEFHLLGIAGLHSAT